MRAVVQDQGYSFPILLDPTGAIISAYGVTGIPTEVFIDYQSVVRFEQLGAMTSAGMDSRAAQYLQPATTTTLAPTTTTTAASTTTTHAPTTTTTHATTTTTVVGPQPTTTTTTSSTTSTTLPLAQHFSDVSSSPYEPAIEALAQAGVIGGYPDGTFRPLNPVLRAQFAKVIDLALGLQVNEGGAPAAFHRRREAHEQPLPR